MRQNLPKKITGVPKPIELLIVAVIFLLFIFPNIVTTSIHFDECNWIANSNYLENWFSADVWELKHTNLADPNMTKLLIGLGRVIAGISPDELNKPYNFSVDLAENRDAGRVPDQSLLVISRIPMSTLVVVLGTFLYYQLSQLESRLVAIIWGIVFVFNDFLLVILSRAMNEAPLLFFSTLCAFCIYRGLQNIPALIVDQHQKKFAQSYRDFLLAGIFLGFAGATKINGLLLSIPPLVMILIVVFRGKSTCLKKKVRIALSLFAAFFLPALIIFMLLNPFLLMNPFIRIPTMLQYRLTIMANQVSRYPEYSQIPLFERMVALGKRFFMEYSSFVFKYSKYFNFVVTFIGLVNMGMAAVVTVKKKAQINFLQTLFIMFSLASLAAFLTPLDWKRYYLFPVFLITILFAKGIEQLILWLSLGIRTAKEKFSSQEAETTE